MERTSSAPRRVGLPTSVWALSVLLAVASALLILGQEPVATPAADSLRPSGTAAFAELLRRSGYSVRISHATDPGFASDEVAVAFVDRSRPDQVDRAILRHLRGGGRALLLGWRPFAAASSRSEQALVRADFRFGGPTLRAMVDPQAEPDSAVLADEPGPAIVAWSRTGSTGDREGVVLLTAVGLGVAASAGSAVSLTNRHIGELDNAAFAIDLVRTVSGLRRKVVFVEAAYGNVREPSLAEAIGPWFATLQWTALFLFCALAYTLGKRFGRPTLDRAAARGSRDLLDAFADSMARGRKADLALRLIANHAELVAPDDEEVRHAINHARSLANQRPRVEEALPVAKVLDEAIRNAGSRRR